MIDNSKHKIGRREFLGSAAAASFMILKPELVRGTAANSAVRLGILGVGGRGTAVGSGFVENAGVRVVALADMFQDALDVGRKHFDELQSKRGVPAIEEAQIFKGPRAFEHIAHSKEVDFVLVTTPPYYHPHHLEEVVKAGKHVYCEKPVAVDVPGAKRVMEFGEKAKGKLSLDVGFQIRMAPPFVDLVERLHKGAIGPIGCGLAYYYCGHLDRPSWPNASDMEKKLRNWVWYRDLSGDIIVEQNVHIIDVCNWIMQGHPEKAVGSRSRKHRTDVGDCSDNYNLVFTYPGDVAVSFGSTQFDNPEFDAAVRFFGTKGSCEAHYDHRMKISGDNPWDAGLGPAKESGQFSAAGTFKGTLDHADEEKQKAFVESITSGNYHNQAQQGAESALSGMLGRMATEEGKLITWEELMKSKHENEPKIDLNKLA